jgi:hypothetical protein
MMYGTNHLQTIMAAAPSLAWAARAFGLLASGFLKGFISGGLVGFAAMAPLLPMAKTNEELDPIDQKQDA